MVSFIVIFGTLSFALVRDIINYGLISYVTAFCAHLIDNSYTSILNSKRKIRINANTDETTTRTAVYAGHEVSASAG